MKIMDIIEGSWGHNRDSRAKYGQDVAIDGTFESHLPKIQVALEQYKKGNIIWRGIPTKNNIVVVDPTKVERKAANTYNFVNTLQSTLPLWKDYPPRNRSLICSGSKDIADSYGSDEPHVVLPFGDPILGIVPDVDWWHAFDVDILCNALNIIFHSTQKTVSKRDLSEDPENFFKDIKTIERTQVERPNLVEVAADIAIAEYFNARVTVPLIYELLSKPLLVSLSDYMDPHKLNFKTVQLSNFTSTRNEIWFSAPALLIKRSQLTSLVGI
jgi:hypothetical protein